MSTPEQPLTRKQMRELLRTGAIPIIRPSDEANDDALDASAERVASPKPDAAPAPVDDEPIDPNAPPRTRRQARQQERLRTLSVPIISPELAEAALAAGAADAEVDEAEEAVAAEAEAEVAVEAEVEAEEAAAPEGAAGVEDVAEAEMAESVADAQLEDADVVDVAVAEAVEADAEVVEASDEASAADDVAADDAADDAVAADDAAGEAPEAEASEASTGSALHAGFGGHLLVDDPEIAAPMPASFDQLIARGSTATGSATATNALILSQTPVSAPLSGAVTATGEILITGTLALPEGLGSTGSDPRLSDGKEIDALLVDGGELPASSSPKPVAASSAISTIKSASEIIKPPVPEKGSRLMFALAITAGALALALVGVLILGFITGAL
ncbi:MAG: hypothetical protein KDB08_03365 [Microthrixaceae bacterium]|nr:hypothetical protein [Microthrixaceae bacterium]